MDSKVILDVSHFQPQIDFPLLYSKGQRHIIIKAGSGSLFKDPKWEAHYTGATAAKMIPDPYFWEDPIYDAFAQGKFFAQITAGKRVGFVVLDFEQYWADWAKWSAGEKGLIPKSEVPILPPETIFNHLVKTYDTMKASFTHKILIYSANWFIDGFCPQAWDWLKDKYTHFADYSTYTRDDRSVTWEELEKLLPIGKKIPSLPATYPLDKVLMWQVSGDKFDCPGVFSNESRTNRSDIDVNIWVNPTITINDISQVDIVVEEPEPPIPPATPKETFIDSVRIMRVLNLSYIPQIGETANMYANDCGAAAGCMMIEAYTDIKVTPDQFYKATGNTIDKYLFSYQIINVMSKYNVGSRWIISNMNDLLLNLRSGKPVICLVLYSVLRDAGLTQSTFSGFHFMITAGCDSENIYMHDPLWNNEGGKWMKVPYAVFEKAWKDAGKDPNLNPAYGCIVPALAIGESSALPSNNYKITATSLTFRSTPNSTSSANIVGYLKYGQIVSITEITADGWGKINKLDGVAAVGWAFMKYMIKV